MGANEEMYSPDSTGRMPALDSLRGAASLLVFFFHVKSALLIFGSLEETWKTPDRYAFAAVSGFGWVGVELFFVLSGFLITGILADARGRSHAYRNFYARRVLRIFPLYYGFILLLLFVYPSLPALQRASDLVWQHQGWYWTYLVNALMVWDINIVPDVSGPLWSLAVEEHFYLFWPPVVLLLGRRRALAACVFMLAACPLMRISLQCYSVMVENNPSIGHFNYLATPARLDAIAVGAVIALLVRGPRGMASLVAPARRVALGAGAVLCGIVAVEHGRFSNNSFWVQSLGLSALSLFFGAVLVLAVSCPADSLGARLGQSRVLRFFGKYSYGIYVYHMSVLILWRYVLFDQFGTLQRFGAPLIGVAIFEVLGLLSTVAIAYLSWHLYEKWFLRLKRYFEY